MNFQTIVVATDFSESSLAALETAYDLALLGGRTVYLVHVMEPYLVTGDPTAMLHPSVEKTYQEARERLDALIPEDWFDEEQAKTLVVKSSVLTASSPAQAVSRFAQGKNADLIIVGTHGRKGLTRMLMGSTAESLLRRSPCPVLVVKHKAVATAA
jgi:nucleotide-binding universal stress UspA family protein